MSGIPDIGTLRACARLEGWAALISGLLEISIKGQVG